MEVTMADINLDDQQLKALSKSRRITAEKQQRDSQGHFIKSTESSIASAPQKELTSPKTSFFSISQGTNTESVSPSSKSSVPPLLDIKITNPVTYLKAWYKKIMANEGIDFKLKVHPLTAIALCLLLAGVSFGLGRFSLPADSPIIKYVPQLAPAPAPDPWKEAAYIGILRYTDSGKKFYLETLNSGVITLDVPVQVNMAKLVSKRILAIGKYNTQTEILAVTEVSDLEILPAQAVPVPLISTTN